MSNDESRATSTFALPERLTPVPERSGLDAPYWSGLREHRLLVQRCDVCAAWQWGPEWICMHCRSADVGWAEVPRTSGDYRGEIFSWERVWHPTDKGLADAVPYLVVLVALPEAGGVRMVGNLLGDPGADAVIDSVVRAVFEDHDDYTLVQWERC